MGKLSAALLIATALFGLNANAAGSDDSAEPALGPRDGSLSVAEADPAPESAKSWLMRQMTGPDGRIDHAGVARALEQRARLVVDTRAKRAGLPATPAGWTNLTGYTQSAGRINHIVFTSASGNDILAGADGGGIWRSTNGGSSWTPVNDFLGSLSITNFARASNDPNTIYAGTNTLGSHTYYPFGIVKSLDGGATWSQIAATSPAANPDFTYVQRVAVHPFNANVVLAATGSGAYQSVDGGVTWTKIGGVATRAYYVAFHPADGNRAAVAYNDGTIRYTTTGDLAGAGVLTATVLTDGRYMKIAYAKSDPARMYALVTDSSTSETRLLQSTTEGASWAEVPGAATALTTNGTFYNADYLQFTGGLWVDPLNANRVAVYEGWSSFTPDISAPAIEWRSLALGWVDIHGVVEHPGYDGATNRTVYYMDSGGLYRLADIDRIGEPGQFTRLDAGMAVTEVYSVAGRGGNTILGAQDVSPRVYRSDPAGGDTTSRWRFVGYPALCPTCTWLGHGATTAASPANPAVLYGSRQYLDIFRSTDGGVTGTSIVKDTAINEGQGATQRNLKSAFIAPFVLAPSDPGLMYAGGHSLWRSANVDTGTPPTWTAIRPPFTDTACGTVAPIAVVAVAPSNPDVVWVAHECKGRVFRSVNATQASPTWTEVTTFPLAATQRNKASITIDRTNPDIVWVGVGTYEPSTLFRTTDGGATAGNWTTITGLPGAPVYSLVQHPANPSWLYAATGVGVFASDDSGATWSTTNEGPANVVVRSLHWNTSGTSSELLAGTFGRGVFKATVTAAEQAPSITTIVSSASPFVVAGDPVTFTATVYGASGTPTGTVNILDGGRVIATVPVSAGSATFTTSALSAGNHSMVAAYLGNTTFAASSSVPLTQTVKLSQTIIFTAPPDKPFGTLPFALGATATSNLTVAYTSQTTPVCTVVGNTVTLHSAGACTIAADQPGDATYAPASRVVQTFAVLKGSPVMTLQSDTNPSDLGQPVTFTATLTGSPAPTGTVAFRDGANAIAGCEAKALAAAGYAVCSTSALTAGGHTITAAYSGDGNYVTVNSQPLGQTVNAPPQPFVLTVATFGSGTVVSNPAGINCGATCTATFMSPSVITLAATPAAGFAFAGWAGACSGTGICAVTMDAAKTVTANFVAQYTLTVAKSGTGAGTVASTPAGISCGATCNAIYNAGTTVSLSAASSSGSVFTGWSGGGCSGTGACVVTMSAATTVTAAFSLAPPSTAALTVATAGTGTGTVTSSPAGIDCGSSCVASFATGASITLTATPAAGSQFAGWSGGQCSGSTGPCTFGIGSPTTETAVFTLPQFTLSVATSGNGTVISSPGGIACGATCSAPFSAGTVVALTPLPDPGYSFAGWSGACTGTGTCAVTMSAERSVSASFTPSAPPPAPHLSNLSTRGRVETGNDVMIGGFVISGTARKKVLITARGPSLAAFGVSGAMANPKLELFAGQTKIVENDDWQTNPAGVIAEIQATGIAPADPRESALLVTLNPGVYTAIVSGVDNGTGVAIVEVFEQDQPDVPLINISTRGQVKTGDNVMIGGFVIQGDQPKKVLITARGPSLGEFGIANPLANPKLELFLGAAKIGENDDFGTAPNVGEIVALVGAPTNPLESALLVTLAPGAYTAVVSGVGGVTGVGIVEVFAQ